MRFGRYFSGSDKYLQPVYSSYKSKCETFSKIFWPHMRLSYPSSLILSRSVARSEELWILSILKGRVSIQPWGCNCQNIPYLRSWHNEGNTVWLATMHLKTTQVWGLIKWISSHQFHKCDDNVTWMPLQKHYKMI